jgi:NAD dependent epimerase/dehydratase family enzyme
VFLRAAIVMNPGPGGPFHLLRTLVRLGLGGRAGDGGQYVSWIHGVDFVAAVEWLLVHQEFEGAVNLAAPNPLPNAEFMRIFREAAHVPLGLPATRGMLETGAFLLRTESELIMKSRRVIPKRLLDGGFRFRFPDWASAARDLCL